MELVKQTWISILYKFTLLTFKASAKRKAPFSEILFDSRSSSVSFYSKKYTKNGLGKSQK